MRTILPPKYRLLPEDATCVFKGKIFDVYQWEQELYDGTTATYEMLKRPDTLQIFAIKDGKLVVLKEEQPSMGPAFYGLPGGRHDVEGETELQAAQRELREETGMEFKDWKLIKVAQPYSKIEWFMYYFVATGFESAGPIHLDAGEKIEVMLLDPDEAIKLAKGDSSRHLPMEFIENLKSFDELADLPEYKG
jgi:ADP-ribose pyrophosphatase